jgi:predicted GH43/DUF377 family glycosyl hydrolase
LLSKIPRKPLFAALILLSVVSILILLRYSVSNSVSNIDVPDEKRYEFQSLETPDKSLSHSPFAATDYGIVYTHGSGPNGCDKLGARDVWVWEDNGTYYMHYDGASDKGWITCLATSTDLLHWKPVGPKLELGEKGQKDGGSASYGVTYYNKPNWYMFYLGAEHVSDTINRVPAFPYVVLRAIAKSPDGPWKKLPNDALYPQPGTYFSETTSPGQIVKKDNRCLMFFSASNKKSPTTTVVGQTDNGLTQKVVMVEASQLTLRSIGIARAASINGTWQPDKNPILPENEQIENSSLYYQEITRTWFLFTNHVGTHEGRDYTDAIWVYWTNNLDKWSAANKAVVLDGSNCSWSKKIIGLPSVLKVDNRLVLFYDGYAGDTTPVGSDVHMRRDIGMAWLELPIKLPEN